MNGMRTLDVDVVVVGGGPAGAAAATAAAQEGATVVLLEKAAFPRYKVGESLLPYCWWILDRLGVREQVAAEGFQAKYSVSFVSDNGRMSKPFVFSDHLDHDASRTWQVDRASFDRILLDNAAEQGVTVLSETRATKLLTAEDGTVVGLEANGPQGEVRIQSKVLVDGSGRDGFVRGQRGWRNAEPRLDRIALWAYHQGIPREGQNTEGTTTIVQLPGDGWCWFIPLSNGAISVGVVAKRDVLFAEGKDREAAYDRALQRNPWLADQITRSAERSPVKVTSDYSYRSTYCADDGVVLCGDAFAFLDPVFSSGVFLALSTGEEAGRVAARAALAGDMSAEAFADYGEWVCRGMEAMRSLVFSFYDPDFSMGRMVKAHPELRGDVTDLLIGNLYRDFSALYQALSEHGDVPDPLPYGRARVDAQA